MKPLIEVINQQSKKHLKAVYMDEFVRYFLPSLLWGIVNGLIFISANWFVNFMWCLASQDGSTKTRKVMLYLGVQVGGLVILAIYVGIAFVCMKMFYRPHDIVAPFVMLFGAILIVIVAIKRKWFKPVVTAYIQFITEAPPKK